MPYKLVEELIGLNRKQSQVFCEAHDARVAYRVDHPTEIAVFKCMDGRLHLPSITETPLGIIQPWRNIGGLFNLGWPFLGEKVNDWVRYAERRERGRLALLTYHFSAGNKHRGCAGFKYDTEAARLATEKLRDQFKHLFSGEYDQVYPVILGIETDFDGLVLHGARNAKWNLEEVDFKISENDVRARLRALYPDMDKVVLNDLLPLVLGNIRHIAGVHKYKRPVIEIEHGERVLAVGQGFDWLHRPNLALIVGPFSPDLAQPIEVAANIIKGNMEAHRIPDSGFVLLTSCPFRNRAEERLMALERTKFYTELAIRVITERVPALKDKVHALTTVIDLEDRKFEIVK